uniref:Glucose dehydrogenase FAD, quinone-like protein n=1 Tax=Tetranychus evansi TaxID=178897 RepID=A0A3G5AP99_9ACAR|nr:glucose dehydrogenase FAD, quinone-like protein [Tetranychus evansi]
MDFKLLTRITLLLVIMYSSMTIEPSYGQLLSSAFTRIRDFRNNLMGGILGMTPISGDMRTYTGLTGAAQTIGNMQSLEMARQFMTVIASSFGPLAVPYSLDFTLSSNMNATYDYIIVGGGSAGATLAARLSENPNIRILLLEAGGEENILSTIPVAAFLLQKSPLDWAYQSEPQARAAFGLNENRIPCPRGKLVGGGSGINYMLYVRGNKMDYDRWGQLGAAGWNYSSVSPYFIKMEGSRDPEGDPGYHGTTGPLTVTPLQETFAVDRAFMQGVQQYGLKVGDVNGAEQQKFTYARYTIRDGKRCSTARAYLAPASSRSNLHVVIFARVNKVLFDSNKRAIGVEFNKDGRTFQVFTRQEVILSAGALNTPQLLMLSGIGPRDQLAQFNIPVIQHSPGVGNNLQEHAFSLLMFTTKFGTSFVYTRVKTVVDAAKYAFSGTGSFASPGLNVIGFWRSKYAYDERPDIQIHELDYIPGGSFPNMVLGYILNLNRDVLFKYLAPYMLSDGTMYAITLVRPRSTGTVKLTSADPRTPPKIDYNLFDDPRDLEAMVEGCKLILNITETPAMKAINTKQFNTPLIPCSKYPFNSDPYLRCLVQTLTYTIYHPTSTAKMGDDNDPMAVLDPYLRVRGVAGLRVIDASAMPEVPTGNTNVPTIVLAERAADLIKGQTLRPQSLPYSSQASILSYS